MLTADDLIAFEADIEREFEAGNIHAPVHLSGGNEQQLIDIFKDVRPEDYVFSTWRSHYHALLKGITPDEIKRQIMAGRSMFIASVEHRFYASAIMGGCLPIACGLAAAGECVWVFIGDMCASTGAFEDARNYAHGHGLDVEFVIENNGLSTNTPTRETWGKGIVHDVRFYEYRRAYAHYQPYGHLRGF